MNTTFRTLSATFLFLSIIAPAGMLARAEEDSESADDAQMMAEEASQTLFGRAVGRIGLRQPCAFLPRDTQENIDKWNACRKERTASRREAMQEVKDNAKDRMEQWKAENREQKLQAREEHIRRRDAMMEARRAWQQGKVELKEEVKERRFELWNTWKRIRKDTN